MRTKKVALALLDPAIISIMILNETTLFLKLNTKAKGQANIWADLTLVLGRSTKQPKKFSIASPLCLSTIIQVTLIFPLAFSSIINTRIDGKTSQQGSTTDESYCQGHQMLILLVIVNVSSGQTSWKCLQRARTMSPHAILRVHKSLPMAKLVSDVSIALICVPKTELSAQYATLLRFLASTKQLPTCSASTSSNAVRFLRKHAISTKL